MSKLTRRKWLALTTSAGALAMIRPAAAQAYPQRPVKIIVPYAPGGGTDVFSRLMAAQIEREFGQPLVIDNRGGGASIVGTQAVATAQPDGYTIGMVDSAFVTNPGLYKEKLPYDTRRDFVPVSLLSRTQLVLAVHPSSPHKTAQDLITYAKANPGKLTFGSAGIGTGIHYAGEQFRQVAGIDIVVVPYRGGAPMVTDFLSGKLDFTFGAIPTIKQHIYDGRARALGTTRGRSPQLPEVPSLEELGLGSVDSTSEMGIIVPAATPAPIVQKLNQIMVNAVRSEPFRSRLNEQGFFPLGTSSDEWRTHIDVEIAKWTKVIEAGNVRPE